LLTTISHKSYAKKTENNNVQNIKRLEKEEEDASFFIEEYSTLKCAIICNSRWKGGWKIV